MIRRTFDLRALAACALLLGCGSPSGSDGGTTVTRTINSSGSWVLFADPYGDGGTNPLTSSLMGGVVATETSDGKTTVKLTVSGAPATSTFGSHVHKLACSDTKGGAHYQHTPSTDPANANESNEIWLDVTTDATGAGTSSSTVNWQIPDGGAKAVVIHAMATAPGGGAGARLACIEVPF
jgi:Cu-Zn family superoxide dismutase